MKKALKWLLAIVVFVSTGVVVARVYDRKKYEIKIKTEKEQSRKYYEMFMLLNNWLRLKHDGKRLEEYFCKRNYRDIAIYGMSFVGEALVDELINTSVNIKYGIDKNAVNIIEDFKVISPDDDYDPVDVIVVTSITYYDDIEKTLRKKTDTPIISIEDVLYSV